MSLKGELMKYMIAILITLSICIYSEITFSKNVALIFGGGCETKHNLFKDQIVSSANGLAKHGWQVSVDYDGTKDPIVDADNLSKDVELSDARKTTILEHLNQIKQQSEAGEIDQLLVNIKTHGSEYPHQVCIEGELLYVDSLQKVLKQIFDNGVKVAVVDNSCFSGNTVDTFPREFCNISTQQDGFTGIAGGGVWDVGVIADLQNAKVGALKGKSIEDLYIPHLSKSDNYNLPEISSFRGDEEQIIRELYIKRNFIFGDINFLNQSDLSPLISATAQSLEDTEYVCKELLPLLNNSLFNDIAKLSGVVKRKKIDDLIGPFGEIIDKYKVNIEQFYITQKKIKELIPEMDTCFHDLEKLFSASGKEKRSVISALWTASVECGVKSHYLCNNAKEQYQKEFDLYPSVIKTEYDKIKEKCFSPNVQYQKYAKKFNSLEISLNESLNKLTAYMYKWKNTDELGNDIRNPCSDFILGGN